MLFSNDKKKDGEAKKSSIFGLLFNPNRDTEIQPVKDSFRMFPKMIALIFVMSGLFPKEHPALTDEKLHLKLSEVLAIAWRNVRFTREGIPSATIFMAVISMLGFSALFIISLLFTLFMGNAHAQAAAPSGSMFVSPATNDLGDGLIDYLFFGKAIQQVGGKGTTDCSFIEALSKALGFFSGAILVFAGIMLLYHLVSMIVKTAQTGKPFEGANQVWGPIRLVFAIALLVPLASTGGATDGKCAVTGYNTGQYLVIKIAHWGAALGSNGWDIFLNSLDTYSSGATTCPLSKPSSPSAEMSAPSCVNADRGVTSLVSSLIVADVCAKYANHYLKELHGTSGSPYEVNDLALGASSGPGKHYLGYKVTKLIWEGRGIWSQGVDTTRFCGGYTLPERPSASENLYTGVYQASTNSFMSLMHGVDEFNKKYMAHGIEGINANIKTDAMYKDYKSLVENYQNSLEKGINQSLKDAKTKSDEEIRDSGGYALDELGWVYAAAWFNTIAKMQSQKFDAIEGAKPSVMSPEFFENSEEIQGKYNFRGVPESTRDATTKYIQAVEFLDDFLKESNSSDLDNRFMQKSDGSGRLEKKSVMAIFKDGAPSNLIADLFMSLGSGFGLWNPYGTLGVKFGMTNNPIAEVVAYGKRLMGYGAALMAISAAFSFFAGVSAEASAVVVSARMNFASIGEFLAGLAIFFASISIAGGFTMAYIVVLYPFYRFFFGTMQWLLTVFEAVVMIPLFALAHINPGGDGLAGQQGKYGYSIAMQIILRPILMVFGLIAGYLLFKATLMLLNEVFIIVTAGSGNLSGWTGFIGVIVYTILYVVFVVLLANNCFKAIGMFPQVALSWLGMQGVKEERFDPAMLGAAAAYFTQQGTGKIVDSTVGAAKGLGKKIADTGEQAKTTRIAENHVARDDAMAKRAGLTRTENPDGSETWT